MIWAKAVWHAHKAFWHGVNKGYDPALLRAFVASNYYLMYSGLLEIKATKKRARMHEVNILRG